MTDEGYRQIEGRRRSANLLFKYNVKILEVLSKSIAKQALALIYSGRPSISKRKLTIHA